jgi:hypothetical protein
MKKCALWVLWIVIAVQTGWMVLQVAKPQQSSGVLGYVGFVTVAFAALAATRGRVRWLATALRIFIGMAFVSAVCDRLGMFGPPRNAGSLMGKFSELHHLYRTSDLLLLACGGHSWSCHC